MTTSKPDLTRVWANNAPSQNVVDPDTTLPGKVTSGWVAEVPPFEHFNFIQQWFSKGLAHMNEQGISIWDNKTIYPMDALTKGSDGKIYAAVIEQSNNNPVGDGGTNWKDAFIRAEELNSNTGATQVGTSSGNNLQIELDALSDGQTGGIIVFSTYALLDAYTPANSAEEKTSYKVTNDPTLSNNGFYSWVSGTTYTKDASLVENEIDVNNTDSGVSGRAVFKEVERSSRTIYTSSEDNLMLNEDLTSGFYEIGGTIGASPTWDKTRLIPCVPNTKYLYTGHLVSQRTIALFDENEVWVEDAKTNVDDVTEWQFTTGPTVRFMGVSVHNTYPVQIVVSEDDVVVDGIASQIELDEVRALSDREDKGGSYKLYQAEIRNTLDAARTDAIIKINMSFKPGEVKSEDCLFLTEYEKRTVPDTAGTGTVDMFDFGDSIPCQWQPDLNDNMREGSREDGYWADGSLRNGKLVFLKTLSSFETRLYYIKSYQGKITDHNINVTSEYNAAAPSDRSIVANAPFGTNFSLNFDGSLLPFDMEVNGNSTYIDRRLCNTSILDSLGTNHSLANNTMDQTNSHATSNITFLGSGIIFKDILVEITLTDFPQIELTYRFRMWANGQLDLENEVMFISDNDSSPALIVDGISTNIAIGYNVATDSYQSVTPNINYISEGHHRTSLNKPTEMSVSSVLVGNQTQSRVESPFMSEGAFTGLVGGDAVWLGGGVDDLKLKNQIEGTHTSFSIRVKFSPLEETLDADRYFYTENQKDLLNPSYGLVSSEKTTTLKSEIKEVILDIMDNMGQYINASLDNNLGSFGQYQLADIILGNTNFTIDDVYISYEALKTEFKYDGVGDPIDYFESYFGISLVDAEAADDGSTYYPPFNVDDSSRPFATQKLGRDFQLVPMLVDYLTNQNNDYQLEIDTIDNFLLNVGLPQSVIDAENAQKDKLNYLIGVNTTRISEFTAEIKELADACVLIIKYSNRRTSEEYIANSVDMSKFAPSGRVWLQWKSSSLPAFNATSAILRFFKQAMDLIPADPNFSEWSAAYDECKAYLINNTTLGDINIPDYTNQSDISIRNVIHYALYVYYDMSFCGLQNEVDFNSFLYDNLGGDGLLFERLCTSNLNRRGGLNSYFYASHITSIEESKQSLSTTLNILKQVQNSFFNSDNGEVNRALILNGWENNQTLEQKFFDVIASGTLANLVSKLYL